MSQNSKNTKTKDKVVSITYEEIGLFPRSFSRVFDRFFKQIFSDVENLVIQEYRFYRYLFLTTIQTIFILLFLPLFVNFIAKTYLIRPITEYFWNTKQTEIFLNSYEQKRAFNELHEFEEKLYFDSLLISNNIYTYPTSSDSTKIAPKLFNNIPRPLPVGEGRLKASLVGFQESEAAPPFPPLSTKGGGGPVGGEGRTTKARTSGPAKAGLTSNSFFTGKPLPGLPVLRQIQGMPVLWQASPNNSSSVGKGTGGADKSQSPAGVELLSLLSTNQQKASSPTLIRLLAGEGGPFGYPLMGLSSRQGLAYPLRGLEAISSEGLNKLSTITGESVGGKDFVDMTPEGNKSVGSPRKGLPRLGQKNNKPLSKQKSPTGACKSPVGASTWEATGSRSVELSAIANSNNRLASACRPPTPFPLRGRGATPTFGGQRWTEGGFGSAYGRLKAGRPIRYPLSSVLPPPFVKKRWMDGRLKLRPPKVDESRGPNYRITNIGKPLQGLPLRAWLGVELIGAPVRPYGRIILQERLQEKTLELAIRYNNHSIESITNFFADFISLMSLLYLLVSLEIQINITKSFLLEVFFGLDDSKKSLLILILTDLLVGYHSSNLWELFFQFLFNHYGIPESQTGIFLLVATLPVLLDVLFKYLIFRHLNRASPATVATYHAIIE